MKHLERLGHLGALILAACGFAQTARATQITPVNTQVTFTSTNALVSFHGGSGFRCTDYAISGRTPATSSTWLVFGVTLTFNQCSIAGFGIGVSFNESCLTAGGTPTMEVMGIGGDAAIWQITLPATCAMQISGSCSATVLGPQTIGNGTVGLGGGVLTGGASPLMHLNNTLIRDVTVHPRSPLCGPAGTGSITLTGNYTSATTLHVDGT